MVRCKNDEIWEISEKQGQEDRNREEDGFEIMERVGVSPLANKTNSLLASKLLLVSRQSKVPSHHYSATHTGTQARVQITTNRPFKSAG